MTFPIINYKYNSIEEAKSLADVVDQKFAPLGVFVDEEAKSACEVEFERLSAHQNGRVHRIEANITINGILYRAEATENTFEEAVDKVRDELDRELSRAKDKQVTQSKDAGRIAKEMLQNS
jgi:ribosomal subunit interface protein